MELRKFIATTFNDYLKDNTIREYLNENVSISFSETQKQNSKRLFLELFDYYLRKVSYTYPMIWHNTTFDKYESISKFGLTGKLNYFSDNDADMIAYGQYDDKGAEISGISVGVNYREVADRLYIDPEWQHDIIVKTGNPSEFKRRNISDEVILCIFIEDMLGLDTNKKLKLSDVPKQKIKDIINECSFLWLYVRGIIKPNLLTIKIHPEFRKKN